MVVLAPKKAPVKEKEKDPRDLIIFLQNENDRMRAALEDSQHELNFMNQVVIDHTRTVDVLQDRVHELMCMEDTLKRQVEREMTRHRTGQERKPSSMEKEVVELERMLSKEKSKRERAEAKARASDNRYATKAQEVDALRHEMHLRTSASIPRPVPVPGFESPIKDHVLPPQPSPGQKKIAPKVMKKPEPKKSNSAQGSRGRSQSRPKTPQAKDPKSARDRSQGPARDRSQGPPQEREKEQMVDFEEERASRTRTRESIVRESAEPRDTREVMYSRVGRESPRDRRVGRDSPQDYDPYNREYQRVPERGSPNEDKSGSGTYTAPDFSTVKQLRWVDATSGSKKTPEKTKPLADSSSSGPKPRGGYQGAPTRSRVADTESLASRATAVSTTSSSTRSRPGPGYLQPTAAALMRGKSKGSSNVDDSMEVESVRIEEESPERAR